MKHLILVLVAIWAAFQIIDLVRSPTPPALTRPLIQFAEPPVQRLSEPYRNAYFSMIGFAASPSLEPAKVGYEMWVEGRETAAGSVFNYDKPGRFDLHMPMSLSHTSSFWDSDDPLTAFRARDSSGRRLAEQYRTLLDRYERCLGMPFEDWGFGQRAVPRYDDLMKVHRLYIADGFVRSPELGIDRLYRELIFWRTVLRAATTMPSKVMAQVIIQDDAGMLSRMLSRPSVDKTILATALQLMIPLTASEYSLRWPVQHQVALAIQQKDPVFAHEIGTSDPSHQEKEWLLTTAHLASHAFEKIEHPSGRSLLPAVFGHSSDDVYAAFYDGVIKASDGGGGRFPKLREIAGAVRRGALATFLNPSPAEPEWETFLYQLMETDAKLRLTSLQVQLRKPNATLAVPVRLAEVGSPYFDPFTGLPMLWSPTQQKIYSVGRDRLDDGGDPSFDITVPAVITNLPSGIAATVGPSSRRLSSMAGRH